jgi:membrane fusion protein, multidrug efflux system
MRKSIVAVSLAAAACAAGLAYWRPNGAHAGLSAAPEETIPVVATNVTVSDFPIVVSGIGTVAAYNVVDVHAQVAGTIEKIGFVEGQAVHPGDLIAELDPRPYQAALQQANANLVRDAAHLNNAQVNLRRYQPLLKNGFASDQQVTNQNSAVQQETAATAGDRAAIFNAETQLSYTRITSPIDGMSGIRRVDVGNIVQPSSTLPIVTITQIQPISVLFTLPQKDLPAVQKAMATHTLTALAYGQDDRTRLDQGTLLLVDNTINQSAGTVQLKATFPNANRMLWPGAFVNVRLTLETRPGGIIVPLTAISQGQNGAFVFIIEPDGTVRQRSVAVAETLDGRALIDHGLQAGDRVVTAGQYRLSDGVHVAAVAADDPHVQNSTEASAGML